MASNNWDVKKTFTPKTYDIDAMGVVSNITYVRWLEDLRTKFLQETIPWNQLEDEKLAPVLSETNINYKNPLQMGDQVEGKLKLVDLGRTTWNLEFIFTMNDETVIEAEQSGLFVDTESHRPKRLNDRLRKKITRDGLENLE